MGSGLYVPVPPPPVQAPVISLLRSAIDGLKQLRQTPSASTADPDSDRWVNGISYEPLDNSDLQLFDACNMVGTDSPQAVPGVLTWTPYVLEADDTCDTFTWRTHDWAGRVTTRVQVGAAKAIEKEFWGGALAQASSNGNYWLTKIGSTQVATSGTPVSVHKAFELLDQALASCGIGSQGYIHCPVNCLPYLTTVRRDGQQLLNARDTRVIPGEGYDGTGPGGITPAAGTAWIFATGPVRVWLDDRNDPANGFYNGVQLVPDIIRDPGLIYEAMNRANNTVTVRGEQFALADWDTQCWFACLATLDT